MTTPGPDEQPRWKPSGTRAYCGWCGKVHGPNQGGVCFVASRIKEPAESVALTGGEWRYDPKLRVQVYVRDKNGVDA